MKINADVNNRISKTFNNSEAPSNMKPDFSDRLKSMLKDVNQKQHTADASIEKVVKGELGIHEGMMSVQEADVSLRYLVQVRAKVMQAYNEIMKMPV